jgi:hypothetical protein
VGSELLRERMVEALSREGAFNRTSAEGAESLGLGQRTQNSRKASSKHLSNVSPSAGVGER